MELINRFRKNCKGTSAVEFALGAPMLAVVVLGIASGWTMAHQVFEMRNAVKVGASYFIQGGSDLDAARSAVDSAWENRPEGSSIEVTRQCTCAAVISACTDICQPTLTAPNMSIRISAVGPADAPLFGLVYSDMPSISQQEIVRVR